MGPLTKHKYPKARQRERRQHLGLTTPPLNECPQCHSPKMQHHACPVCGSYGGREEAVKIKEPKKKTS